MSIIKCLECINRNAGPDECSGCPYSVSEVFEIGGKTLNTESIDCERVINDAVETLKAMQWIPVSERLPEPDDYVLICAVSKSGNRNVTRSYYSDSCKCWSGMHRNVTHWMPLPEPPEVNA